MSHEKTWTWLRQGSFKREIESLIIAAQNNAVRSNHIKTRIDKTQQNSKCRLWGDWEETINHISDCSKLVQNYKTGNDWVGKVIHWEIWMRFKFDHTNKWYMHKPAAVLENDTHKLRWDFDIKTDHLISTRKPDLIIINDKKRHLQNCRLSCTGWPQNKTETKNKYLGLARELKKKLWSMKMTITLIVIGALATVTKRLLKGLDDFEVGGRVKTIKTTALLITARILRRVLETWGDLLSFKLQWKTIS